MVTSTASASSFASSAAASSGAALLQCLLQLGADGVCHLAHDGALLGRQLAHMIQNGSQLALFAKHAHAHGIQRGHICRRCEVSQCFRLDLFQLFFHVGSPFCKEMLQGKEKVLRPKGDERQNFRGTTRHSPLTRRTQTDNGATRPCLIAAERMLRRAFSRKLTGEGLHCLRGVLTATHPL